MDETTQRILLVEDSFSVLQQLMQLVTINHAQYILHAVPTAEEGIAKLSTIKPALVIVAVESDGMQGMSIINWIRKERLPIAVIAASADSTPEVAASSIRAGATDFLLLPTTPDRMRQSIEQSLQSLADEHHRSQLDHPIYDESALGFIGAGKSMYDVSKLIISAAKSDASVFITGENGTGKEVCAQLIHKLSKRAAHAMVPLNCAAIPKELAESEMFGHVKGAFTGAVEERAGVAKLAHKGTLFLDEIGEMIPDLQSKFLRFLQTGTFNKVGSGQLEQVDVRFICATNRDPDKQIAAGQFREDLFYRLNVIHIHLPPLRNRGDDILVFARNFLQQFCQQEHKTFTDFSPETASLLKSYSWPGNVRELQNVIRSIVVLHDGQTVIPSMLPMAIIREKGDCRRREGDREQPLLVSNKMPAQPSPDPYLTIVPLEEVMEEAINQAIYACDGNIVEAAHKLQVSPSTIYRKLKRKNREARASQQEVLSSPHNGTSG